MQTSSWIGRQTLIGVDRDDAITETRRWALNFLPILGLLLLQAMVLTTFGPSWR